MSQISNFVTAASIGAITTLSGDSGGPISPTAGGNISLDGGTNITTVGAGNTITINLDDDISLNSVATSNAASGLTITDNTISADGTDAQIDLKLSGSGSSSGVTISDGLTVGLADSDLLFTVNGVSVQSALAIDTQGATNLGSFRIMRHTDTVGLGGIHYYSRSRGTHLAETIVQDDDDLGRMEFLGFDGTDYAIGAEILVEVDGTPGLNDMPGRIKFSTSADGSQTPTLAMTIDSSQVVTLANALAVSSGGSGRATATAYAVICGGTTATGAHQSVASVGTSGQVLTSNGAGALPTFQDAAGGGLSWSVVTGTTQAMVAQEGYFANNAGTVTATLPATAAVGDTFAIAGMNNSTGWTIAQNAGQTIHFGTSDTTTGVGGSLSSTATYDSVELVCNVANTDFIVVQSVGNITVV